DMIVSGGFNVYPREVEDVIAQHPAVAVVGVIGVPDEKWGEAVKAVVVLREGMTADPEELKAMVKEAKGSVHTPKSVDFIDAFLSVRRGDLQWSLQTSGIRPTDKLKQQVGPYKLEVVEPFKTLHITSDDDEVGCDLWFESDYGPEREPQHVKYGGPTGKVI